MSTDLTWSDSPIHDELAAWELLKEARSERDEARAEMIRWMSIAEGRGRTDDEEEQLAAVTAQRDEAREYADRLAQGLPDGMLPKDVEVLREANLGLATELATVTAQRDRLAEALEQLMTYQPRSTVIAMNEHHVWRDAKEALQSLTPNAKP